MEILYFKQTPVSNSVIRSRYVLYVLGVVRVTVLSISSGEDQKKIYEDDVDYTWS